MAKKFAEQINEEVKINKWFWFFVIVILALLIYSYFSRSFVYTLFNAEPDEIQIFVSQFGIYAGIALFLIIIFSVIIAPIPGTVLNVVAGLMFGGFWGGILALIGGTIGAIIDFYIARKFLGKYIESKIEKIHFQKFDEYTLKYGYIALFLLRLNPLTSSDVWSYLSGLTKMRFRDFLSATFFGILPVVFLTSYFGYILISHKLLYSAFLFMSLIYIIVIAFIIYKIIRANAGK